MTSRLVLPRPARGMARALARAPLALSRARLGWLLGGRFLVLIHRGRRTGRVHRTVLEVVNHEPRTATYHVVSGWGPRAEWYRNVVECPTVELMIGTRHVPAMASRVSRDEADRIFRDYAARHRYALRWVGRLFGVDLGRGAHPSLPLGMAMIAFRTTERRASEEDRMTDLQLLGLGLIGFAVSVIVAGILLGVVGSRATGRRRGH